MLVVDASVAVAASLARDGWADLRHEELLAPPLLMSEACSALHEARWRGEISADVAVSALESLLAAPVVLRGPDSLRDAWSIAERLGWAKTYDAEYVALAHTLGCRMVTLDGRLERGVRGIVETVGPAELWSGTG